MNEQLKVLEKQLATLGMVKYKWERLKVFIQWLEVADIPFTLHNQDTHIVAYYPLGEILANIWPTTNKMYLQQYNPDKETIQGMSEIISTLRRIYDIN
jgi:hypothetical protein